MRLKRGWLGLFALILLLQIASASFTVDLNSSNVKKTYNLGEKISGTLVITFENESLGSVLTTNIGSDKKTLKEWMDNAGRKEKVDYNCSSDGCLPNYQIKNEITQTNILIQQPKTFGFKISGSNVSVKSISFDARSSLPNSCTKQFSIDAMGLGKYSLENYRYTNNTCSNIKQGCFSGSLSSSQYQLASLSDTLYCEKIQLDPAPAYSFGAKLTKLSGAKQETIDFDLYESDFTIHYGNCSISSLMENVSCIIPYPITEVKEYSICISSNNTNSQYQIRTEYSSPVCGSSNLGQTYTRDFEMLAQAMEYGSDTVNFNEDIFALLNDEQNFSDAVNKYLYNEYKSDCARQECFVPFTVLGASQQISLSNISIAYESDGVVINEDSFYDIEKTPSSIRSGRMILSLEDTGLEITQKGTTLQLNIANQTVFKTNVNITSAPFSIEPTFALIGIPTTFRIRSNQSIREISWKFSDDTRVYAGNSTVHAFEQAGKYTLSVTATTSAGKTYTSNHQIMVGEARASAEELLRLSEQKISTLSQNIKNVPVWILPGVQSQINVVQLNNSLMTIRDKFQYAANDSEYLSVIEQINSLQIPSNLGITRTGQFPLIYTYSNINVEYVNSLYQTEQSAEQLQPAILEWTRDNYEGTIESNTYGISTDDDSQQAVLTHTKIKLSPKNILDTEPYLIIDYPLEALHFITGYSQKELQSGTYIPIKNVNEVEFYIEEDVAIDSLGMYILPSLQELEQGRYSYEVSSSADDSQKKVTYIALGCILIALAIITGALQHWYRNNYERHLFKDEESLYNVMTFVYNAKKKSLKEGDIRKSLLASGWTREQINYALGRFEGKIFGLFGIPIYSARQEEKMKSSIELRQRQNTGRKIY